MGRYRSLMLPLSVFVPIYKSPVSVMATEVNKDIAGFNLSGVTLILWTGTSHVYPPPSLSLSLSLSEWYGIRGMCGELSPSPLPSRGML